MYSEVMANLDTIASLIEEDGKLIQPIKSTKFNLHKAPESRSRKKKTNSHSGMHRRKKRKLEW